RRLASPLEPDLLALLGACVPRQELARLQCRPELLVEAHQRPRDAMPNGIRLTADPATDDGDDHIEAIRRAGDAHRLDHRRLVDLAPAEVLAAWLAIDGDVALAGVQAHPGDGRLAA